MIGNGYVAFYSDDTATVVRERDYSNYFRPASGDAKDTDSIVGFQSGSSFTRLSHGHVHLAGQRKQAR